MKKIVLVLMFVLAMVLSACTPEQVSAVNEIKSDVLEDVHEQEPDRGYFEGSYIFEGSFDDVSDELWGLLGYIYSSGLEEEYRSFIIKESDSCKAYVVKSNAATPFELVTEIKENVAGFSDIVFQAICGTEAIVFTKDWYMFQSIDLTDYDVVESKKCPLDGDWTDRVIGLTDAFTYWDAVKGGCGADLSPWHICGLESWKTYNLYSGYYDVETNVLATQIDPVTVYRELYGAGDVISLWLE